MDKVVFRCFPFIMVANSQPHPRFKMANIAKKNSIGHYNFIVSKNELNFKLQLQCIVQHAFQVFSVNFCLADLWIMQISLILIKKSHLTLLFRNHGFQWNQISTKQTITSHLKPLNTKKRPWHINDSNGNLGPGLLNAILILTWY